MLIEISKRVLIEDAPPRKQAVATEELLDDAMTASHYKAPRKATKEEIGDPTILTKGDLRLFPDSMGKPIELGKPMDYIDWRCAEADRVWNVYELKEFAEKDKDDKPIKVQRFVCAATFPTMEEANAFAITLK